jgi:transketolase
MRVGRHAHPGRHPGRRRVFNTSVKPYPAQGTDVTIIACGVMVSKALTAARCLSKEGIQPEVINMHTIKPLDKEAILKSVEKTGAVVTAEDHT